MNTSDRMPFFSIVIPTYNSGRTLERTLRSVFSQTIDKNELDVIVVDGYSDDDTLRIAGRYDVRIIHNEKRLPEYAKSIGAGEAKELYLIRLDSDEEFIRPDQLEKRKTFLLGHPEIKMMISDGFCSASDRQGIASEYSDCTGDPFSYFIYRLRKTSEETYRKNIIHDDGSHLIMKFGKNDIWPLVDSKAAVHSLSYIREKYAEEYTDTSFICSTFDHIIADTQLCGCIRNDFIRHNCNMPLKKYIAKLRFRVINNVFHKEESGFSSRIKINPALQKRRILFCLYVLCVPLPVADSIHLAVRYRSASFLIHFICLYYVAGRTAVSLLKKSIGENESNPVYGE